MLSSRWPTQNELSGTLEGVWGGGDDLFVCFKLFWSFVNILWFLILYICICVSHALSLSFWVFVFVCLFVILVDLFACFLRRQRMKIWEKNWEKMKEGEPRSEYIIVETMTTKKTEV